MKPFLGLIFTLFLAVVLSPAAPFPTAQATNHVPDGLTPADWAQIQSQLAPEEITTYSQQAKLTASDSVAFDYFGWSVAVSGGTAVIGAWQDDDGGPDSGSAYVFTRTAGVWSQQAKLTASDAATFDYFGWSVAVSGDTAIIGAYQDDLYSGSAYVFTRSGGVWSQQAKLTASDATTFDEFGISVAVSGDTAVIGADQDDDGGSFSGSAYVFTRTAGMWSQQAKLIASDSAASDVFGLSVAVDGDTAVIGAYRDDDGGEASGSAYVFTRTGGVWSQQAKLTASDSAAFDYFGWSVAVSGNTAVIGAWQDDDGGPNSGSAYVFTRTGGVWSQQAKLIASDAAEFDVFGHSVAVSGDTAVIGAYRDTDGGDYSGSAYLFTRTAGVWSQQAKLTASDTAMFDEFGRSVAVSGDTAIIGAFLDDDGGSNSGSAYVFTPTSNPLTLTLSGTGNGNVVSQPSGLDCGMVCTSIFITNTVVTLTATADTGSTFTGWSGDINSTANPITVTMDSAKAITATFALNEYELTTFTTGNGVGTVSPAGGTYPYGTVITLTATAEMGSTFTGWNGDVSSTSNPITLTIDSAKAITATFALNEYELTTATAGNGAGTVSPAGGTYLYGTVVTLTATADTGSTFTGWSGDVSSTANPITVTMDSAKNITATFALNEYELTTTTAGNGAGTVSPAGGTYPYGTVVTLTATAGTESVFTSWSGDVSSSANPITVTIDGDKDITATFTLNEYELTTSTAGNGAGTVSPAGGTYLYGTVVTLTATADTGSTFTGWSGDVSSTANPITVTMDSAKDITATFALNEYTIAVSAEPAEGGTVTGGGEVTHGQVVTVTATAGSGYTFVNWTEDGDVVSTEANYSFTAAAGRNLVAHFAAIPPSLPKIYLPLILR